MARQYLQDDGFLEPAITDPLAANVTTSAVGMWNTLQYALIPAYDSRPGKVYVVEAAGLITTAATGALTISPTISTTNAAGTTLGASIAQNTPVSSLSEGLSMSRRRNQRRLKGRWRMRALRRPPYPRVLRKSGKDDACGGPPPSPAQYPRTN